MTVDFQHITTHLNNLIFAEIFANNLVVFR